MGSCTRGIAIALAVSCPGVARAAAIDHADVAAPLPSKDVRWSAVLAGAVDVGSLPRAAPGLSLAFDVRRGALGFRAVGSAFLPQVERASGAAVALFDAMAMICALAPIGKKLDVGMCGGGGVGLLHEQGRAGVHDAASTFRPQGLTTVRVDVAIVPSVLLTIEGGVVLDPLRTRLPLAAPDDAYRGSLFSFRGSIGLVVRLW